jgi:hypothetical protein
LIEGDIQMKTTRTLVISLAMALLSAPLLSGQDLSRYRKFSLGTSLAAVSKQVGQDSRQATLIHERPAVIQTLTDWPLDTSGGAVGVNPVSQIVFTFCNGELFKMVVTYDNHAIEGLTEDDMVRAISGRYGTGTRLYPEINLPTHEVYEPRDTVIARWDDPQNSVSLIRSGIRESFELVVLSKRLDAEARASSIESVRLDQEEAPQKEIDRKKKEVDDLEVARQANQKTFRP